MTKVNAEIRVPKPEDTVKVVETLIKNGFVVVIRANAYDDCAPAIFVRACGKHDGEFNYDNGTEDWNNLHEYFDQMLRPVGGDVAECGPGHEDCMREVVPSIGLQFAIDAFDSQDGIRHRISCAKYTPDHFVKIAIAAAGLLADTQGKSAGNALARRLLLAALGLVADAEEDEDDIAA